MHSEIETNRDKLVSVIIPVYNVEKYIHSCMISVLFSSYGNLEIICIDDGSSDESGKICDRYADKYDNIVCVHQTNRGLSAARNAGMKIAHGSFLTFVDSDDRIHPKMIETLVRTAEETGADLAVCENRRINGNNDDLFDDVSDQDVTSSLTVYTAKGFQEAILKSEKLTVAWGKVYRATVAKACSFPEGLYYEDNFFMAQVLARSSKVTYTDCKLYDYRNRENSIITSQFSWKQIDYLESLQKMINEVALRIPELKDIAIVRLYTEIINLYCDAESLTVKEQQVFRRRILEYKKQNPISLFRVWNTNASYDRRILICISLFSFKGAAMLKKRARGY